MRYRERSAHVDAVTFLGWKEENLTANFFDKLFSDSPSWLMESILLDRVGIGPTDDSGDCTLVIHSDEGDRIAHRNDYIVYYPDDKIVPMSPKEFFTKYERTWTDMNPITHEKVKS